MDINEQPDEEIHRSWSGRVINTGASVPDLGCATLWARGCILVYQNRNFPNSVLLVFMEASLQRHDWLNHWSLVTEINFQPLLLHPYPLPFLEVGGGAESSNPLITGLVLLATSPHPWGLSKSHLININSGVVERGLLWTRHLYPYYPLGNSKGFRNSVPETEWRPNISYYIITISHKDTTLHNLHQINLGTSLLTHL